MKYPLNILNAYIDKGLVIKQEHPTLPLAIYNYSRTCQYDRLWDPVTLDCRGLVLDNEGNVIAKPFPKFFNMEELSDSEIPNESFEVFEKMDGSLGICFYYESEMTLDERMHYWFNNSKPNRDVCDYVDELNDELKAKELDSRGVPTKIGQWHMATRGSFNSEQSIKGRELLNNYNYKNGLIPGYTYLFEIIYPENRIVVDYGGYEGLVVLAAFDTETGKEVSIDEMVNEGFDIVKKYDGINDFAKLKGMVSDNAEGFVIRFKSGMRMKIKGDEYVRLHRILTNFSTTDIWELLSTGGDMNEFLDRVPDEFDKWVKTTISDLRYAYFQVSERAGKLHDGFRYGKYGDVDPEPTKKEFAEFVMKQDIALRPVMFAMWDRKKYDHIIWKMIKPKWSKPFKKDIDN